MTIGGNMKKTGFIDFRDAGEVNKWVIVDDVVMGGLSGSDIQPEKEGARFSGAVSLKNNGGFSSVRRNFPGMNMNGYDGIALTLTGDGRRYGVSLSDRARFTGLYFNARFETVNGEKIIINLPFEDFKPLYYGRPAPDVKPIDLSSVKELSLIISDKQEGPFTLLIEKIELYRIESLK